MFVDTQMIKTGFLSIDRPKVYLLLQGKLNLPENQFEYIVSIQTGLYWLKKEVRI